MHKIEFIVSVVLNMCRMKLKTAQKLYIPKYLLKPVNINFFEFFLYHLDEIRIWIVF